MFSNNFIEYEDILKMKIACMKIDTNDNVFDLLEELKFHVKLDEQDIAKILEINNSVPD